MPRPMPESISYQAHRATGVLGANRVFPILSKKDDEHERKIMPDLFDCIALVRLCIDGGANSLMVGTTYAANL